MPATGLLLDALTLVLVISYLLSIGVALLPEPKGDGAMRSRESLLRLGLPPLGGMIVVAAALWPSARAALGGSPDHCGPLAASHPHLCWLHGTPNGGTIHDAVVLAVLMLVAGLLLWNAWKWGQARGRLELLRSATDATRSAEVRQVLGARGMTWPGEIHVVTLGVPLCLVAGLRTPRLYLSTAVLDGMSPEHLAAIVSHERAHVTRGDNIWRLIGKVAELAHLPWLGRRSYRRWTFAAEIACDQAAASAQGSAILVAEALVRYQRLLNDRAFAPAPLGAAFAEAGTLERRVTLLLDPPPSAHPLIRYWPWAALVLIAWQTDGVHDLLEALLECLHG